MELVGGVYTINDASQKNDCSLVLVVKKLVNYYPF